MARTQFNQPDFLSGFAAARLYGERTLNFQPLQITVRIRSRVAASGSFPVPAS
jgi:hypothetical protein